MVTVIIGVPALFEEDFRYKLVPIRDSPEVDIRSYLTEVTDPLPSLPLPSWARARLTHVGSAANLLKRPSRRTVVCRWVKRRCAFA